MFVVPSFSLLGDNPLCKHVTVHLHILFLDGQLGVFPVFLVSIFSNNIDTDSTDTVCVSWYARWVGSPRVDEYPQL